MQKRKGFVTDSDLKHHTPCRRCYMRPPLVML